VIRKWVRERLHSENAWERLFIYVAGAAEEGLTMLGRKDVPLAASGPQQEFGDTLGRTRKLIGRELCKNIPRTEIV